MSTEPTLDPRLFELYDRYCHGYLTRRQFMDRVGAITASGVAAAAAVAALLPDYARAAQVAADDPDIRVAYREYDSPEGAGTMRGYLAVPAGISTTVGAVLVIHENRGLNPYIEDVARRVAKAGFIGFAPDALTPFGGYPGNDDEGREMQRRRNRDEMLNDFIAGVRFLQAHPQCNGRVGCVGFCYGGGVSNELAVRLPELAAAVPFYGRQAATEDVPRIRAPLLIHYAEDDERVNAGWPAYKAALEAAGKKFEAYIYPGTRHGFHNDSTPRYDKAAAELAWSRSIEFFRANLV